MGSQGGDSIEEILDAIGDPYVRQILVAICQESQSAMELSNTLGFSPQTVYRRINLLKDHDLITTSMEIASDGNHYEVFESNFDSALISIEDDEYDVRIYRRENLPDRFTSLWEELSKDT